MDLVDCRWPSTAETVPGSRTINGKLYTDQLQELQAILEHILGADQQKKTSTPSAHHTKPRIYNCQPKAPYLLGIEW